MKNPGPCRLCLSGACEPAGFSQHRPLLYCPDCGLVFVPEAHWLSVDDERARYAHHDNTVANQGYVKFLGEVAGVVCGLCEPGARVLDFGSGANGVMAGLLRGLERDCVAYDPLYGLGAGAVQEKYDAIVVCEVIEHLRDLRGELSTIATCLRAGGAVVVRTQCYPSVAQIPTWWYARDATHLNFFAQRTLDVAANLCGLTCRGTSLPDIFVWSSSELPSP